MNDDKAQQQQSSQTQKAPHEEGEARKKELLTSLMRELFQAERSAQRHPRVEADRLHGRPPARDLEAVARHADAVMQELPIRAKHHHLPASVLALTIGSAFSEIRRQFADYFIDQEESYRATLLGLRHGLDVMLALREAANAAGDEELGEWCERILQARMPLVDGIARQLTWFAQHPEEAMARPLGGVLGKVIDRLKSKLEKVPHSFTVPAEDRHAQQN